MTARHRTAASLPFAVHQLVHWVFFVPPMLLSFALLAKGAATPLQLWCFTAFPIFQVGGNGLLARTYPAHGGWSTPPARRTAHFRHPAPRHCRRPLPTGAGRARAVCRARERRVRAQHCRLLRRCCTCRPVGRLPSARPRWQFAPFQSPDKSEPNFLEKYNNQWTRQTMYRFLIIMQAAGLILFNLGVFGTASPTYAYLAIATTLAFVFGPKTALNIDIPWAPKGSYVSCDGLGRLRVATASAACGRRRAVEAGLTQT